MSSKYATEAERVEARRRRNREWNAQNRQSLNRAGRRWRAAHPERQAAATRRFRADNPTYDRDYKRAHLEETRASRRGTAKRQSPERRRAWNRYNYDRRRGVRPDAEALEFAEIVRFDPCAFCGERPGGTVDHIVAVAAGGTGSAENLTGACQSCNASKGRRPLLIYLVGRG